MRLWVFSIAVLVMVVACSHVRPSTRSTADRRWSATLDSAQRLAADSQYALADSVLAAFAQNSPGSVGAHETIFWHGLFALEPANGARNTHEARTAFDSYLADSGALPHRSEALALRDATHVIDSLQAARAADSVPAVHVVVTNDSLRATERELELGKSVKRLQDSLDKTTAELDRIKKRISTGKPSTP